MSIAASHEERNALAAKIAWLENLKNHASTGSARR